MCASRLHKHSPCSVLSPAWREQKVRASRRVHKLRQSNKRCFKHLGGRMCQYPGCENSAQTQGVTEFCGQHNGGYRCKHPGCTNMAFGSKDLCCKHGRVCQHEGCDTSAVGSTKYCRKHNGGKRCAHLDCTGPVVRKSDYCWKHGGRMVCDHVDCERTVSGNTNFCSEHGGLACSYPGCLNCPRDVTTGRCAKHGGGYRCVSCAMFCVPKGGTCYACRSGTDKHERQEDQLKSKLLEWELPGPLTTQ